MKLGHMVKAGLLAGALASTAQAQSLTGTLNGNAFSSATGVVGPCDIGLGPILGTRSCSFTNTVTGSTNITVNGLATVTWDPTINGFIYSLNYSFNGTALAQPNQNAMANANFAFGIPLAPQTWTTGSSAINISVTLDRQNATLATNGSLGSFVTSSSYLAGNPLPNQGLDLNPSATASQPVVGVPLTISDAQSSGPLAINATFDENVVGFGFQLSSVADRASFSGTGNVTFSNVVPEPSTYALFATGLIALAAAARRRRSV